MPDQMEAKRPKYGGSTGDVVIEEDESTPTFQRLDTKIPDQPVSSSRKPKGVQEEYTPSFQQLDEQMPDQLAIKSTKYSGLEEGAEDLGGSDFEFTYEKIDEQMKTKWEQDPSIASGKTATGRKTQVLEEEGAAFERVDREKASEWEKDGIVSTPKAVQPKGFFDEVALPVEEGKDEGDRGEHRAGEAAEPLADGQPASGPGTAGRGAGRAVDLDERRESAGPVWQVRHQRGTRPGQQARRAL